MAYGSMLADTIQSSTAATPPVFNDGNGTQIGQLTKGWANFNGVTSITTRATFNISGITRNSAGDYTVTVATAFSDANYSSVISIGVSTSASTIIIGSTAAVAPTSSAIRYSVNNGSSGAAGDATYNSICFSR